MSPQRPITAHRDPVAQRIRDAGLPADTLAARRVALPAPVQDLHRQVLTAIAQTGRPPGGALLAADADARGIDLGLLAEPAP